MKKSVIIYSIPLYDRKPNWNSWIYNIICKLRYNLLYKNSAGEKKFFFVKLLFRIGLEIRFRTVSDFVGMACRADYLLLLVAGRGTMACRANQSYATAELDSLDPVEPRQPSSHYWALSSGQGGTTFSLNFKREQRPTQSFQSTFLTNDERFEHFIWRNSQPKILLKPWEKSSICKLANAAIKLELR